MTTPSSSEQLDDTLRSTRRGIALTLANLRKRPPEKALEALAKTFNLHPNTLRNWENPDLSGVVSLENLLKYQRFFGIPVGATVLIGQMAALAETKDRRRLEVLARIVKALANRVLRKDGYTALDEYDDSGDELSDRIIQGLFDAVRADVHDNDRQCFRDKVFRQTYEQHKAPSARRTT